MYNLKFYREKMREVFKKHNTPIVLIAKKLHISKSRVYRLFQGRSCSVQLINDVCKLLGMNADEILIFRYKCNVQQSCQEKVEVLHALERLGKVDI